MFLLSVFCGTNVIVSWILLEYRVNRDALNELKIDRNLGFVLGAVLTLVFQDKSNVGGIVGNVVSVEMLVVIGAWKFRELITKMPRDDTKRVDQPDALAGSQIV